MCIEKLTKTSYCIRMMWHPLKLVGGNGGTYNCSFLQSSVSPALILPRFSEANSRVSVCTTRFFAMYWIVCRNFKREKKTKFFKIRKTDKFQRVFLKIYLECCWQLLLGWWDTPILLILYYIRARRPSVEKLGRLNLFTCAAHASIVFPSFFRSFYRSSKNCIYKTSSTLISLYIWTSAGAFCPYFVRDYTYPRAVTYWMNHL